MTDMPPHIANYIAAFPAETRALLEELRLTIKNAAPGAEEVISYKMPAFRLHGMLVWYAAFSRHIGFYPKSAPIEFYKAELAEYKTSKGTIQFALDKPLPLDLIAKIVTYRVRENLEKANAISS